MWASKLTGSRDEHLDPTSQQLVAGFKGPSTPNPEIETAIQQFAQVSEGRSRGPLKISEAFSAVCCEIRPPRMP
jgi:hypothetical protein